MPSWATDTHPRRLAAVTCQDLWRDMNKTANRLDESNKLSKDTVEHLNEFIAVGDSDLKHLDLDNLEEVARTAQRLHEKANAANKRTDELSKSAYQVALAAKKEMAKR